MEHQEFFLWNPFTGWIGRAMVIPREDDPQPEWIKKCHLEYTYGGDIAEVCNEGIWGKVGDDVIVYWGENSEGEAEVDILPYDDYGAYRRCDSNGNHISTAISD